MKILKFLHFVKIIYLPMNVILNIFGQVKINDELDIIDVQASGSYVRCNHDLHSSRLELEKCVIPHPLRLVSVNADGAKPFAV